jgi:MFS family permease
LTTRLGSAKNELVTRTFAALRHRNYRLYFAGQAVSLVGTWMQIVASGWLVLRITDSAFLLGVITAMESLPSLFLSALAGALADAVDRRRIAIVTQSLAACQALALGLLVVTGHATFWSVFWLATFAGVVTAIDLPTRQSLVYDLVGPEDILNATALNSMLFNAARIVGPAFAALIIARAGEAANFFTNAVSYVFVVAALAALSVESPGATQGVRKLTSQVAEGIGYVVHHPVLGWLFGGMVIYSIFGFNYILLMPVIARFQLHGNASTFGLMMTSLGIGAFAGAAIMAGRRHGSLRSLLIMAFVFPLSLIVFALPHTLELSVLACAALGISMISFVVRFSTFLQTEVPDDMRGRTLGLYNTVLMGLAPFGALQAGALAQAWGAERALIFGALVCIAAAALMLLLPKPLTRVETDTAAENA